MVKDWIYVSIQELTVQTEEVVEQLEKREAIPTLGGLDLQSSVHVDGVKGQEVFSVLHHEVRPPRKRLETQHDGPVQKMNVYSASDMRWNAGHQHGRKRERQIWQISKTNYVELLTDVHFNISTTSAKKTIECPKMSNYPFKYAVAIAVCVYYFPKQDWQFGSLWTRVYDTIRRFSAFVMQTWAPSMLFSQAKRRRGPPFTSATNPRPCQMPLWLMHILVLKTAAHIIVSRITSN